MDRGDHSFNVESLEQENIWLSKRLKLYEEQLRDGEDANLNLLSENEQLKQVIKIQHLSRKRYRVCRPGMPAP